MRFKKIVKGGDGFVFLICLGLQKLTSQQNYSNLLLMLSFCCPNLIQVRVYGVLKGYAAVLCNRFGKLAIFPNHPKLRNVFTGRSKWQKVKIWKKKKIRQVEAGTEQNRQRQVKDRRQEAVKLQGPHIWTNTPGLFRSAIPFNKENAVTKRQQLFGNY